MYENSIMGISEATEWVSAPENESEIRSVTNYSEGRGYFEEKNRL